VSAFDTLEALTDAIGETSQIGDLVLAMGAGDVNSLWRRLEGRNDPANALPLVA
jgi:UDP-N-acetylmuramate--alanine ligase